MPPYVCFEFVIQQRLYDYHIKHGTVFLIGSRAIVVIARIQTHHNDKIQSKMLIPLKWCAHY